MRYELAHRSDLVTNQGVFMRLTSSEQNLLCNYIRASTEQRIALMAAAQAARATSGPLLIALRWATQL